MSTELAPITGLEVRPITEGEIGMLWRVANALAQSGFFKDAKQAQQAFAKILFGRDLGLSATHAMTAIHIVEGKPELSAGLQAAMVRRAPGYDYRVQWLKGEKVVPDGTPDIDGCRITFTRDGEELGESTFNTTHAAQAGLLGRNTYKSYLRNMLFARAMSNGVHFHCPEVTGGIRVYAEGEAGEHRDETPAAQAPTNGQTPDALPPAVEATAEEMPGGDGPSADDLPEHAMTLMADVVDRCIWTDEKLAMQLTAAGAKDTTTVQGALLSMDAEARDGFLNGVAKLIEEADWLEDQAKAAGKAQK